VFVFFIALVICVLSAAIATVLHFQMKFRLVAAGLPVKWLMMPTDDFRMWKVYKREASANQWPIWPFYVYRGLQVVFGASAVFIVLNSSRLADVLLRLNRLLFR
jgi:hypothetical protein